MNKEESICDKCKKSPNWSEDPCYACKYNPITQGVAICSNCGTEKNIHNSFSILEAEGYAKKMKKGKYKGLWQLEWYPKFK
jgi:predicted amidophosphoribosyltransferase